MQNTEPNMSPDEYMRLAIGMAQKVPQYPFGAVIVGRSTGEVLAKGYNRSSRNPIVHGEIDVINRCAAAHERSALSFKHHATLLPCLRSPFSPPPFLLANIVSD